MKYWNTAEGDEIPYNKITDTHLKNILKWIKERADDGMTIMEGGGIWDVENIWFEEYEIDGKEVLERYDYKGLLKEAKRRKLKI